MVVLEDNASVIALARIAIPALKAGDVPQAPFQLHPRDLVQNGDFSPEGIRVAVHRRYFSTMSIR